MSIDVFVFIFLAQFLAKRLRAKGYSVWYAAPALLGWLAGGVASFAIGASLQLGLISYGLTFVGSIVGATLGSVLLLRLPARAPGEDWLTRILEVFR